MDYDLLKKRLLMLHERGVTLGQIVDRELMMGWYSRNQAAKFGGVIYEDINGEDVFVSEVSSCITNSNWDDLVFVGFVTNFVRRVDYGYEGCRWPNAY